MGALGSYWNPWKRKMELSVLFLLDGPSRNTWPFWTSNKDFISVETSHKENPLLRSTSRSYANLGPNWDVSLQRSFQSHLFNFLNLFISLFPFSVFFLSKSGSASPVFAPKPNPTGRFSSPTTRGMLSCAESREVVQSPSLEMPKNHVDVALEDTI